jgi:hypothetical protein
MSSKKYKKLPKVQYAPHKKDESYPRKHKGWMTPDMLEILRDQMLYAEVVKEEYERAKACFLQKNKPKTDGVPTPES